MRLVKNVFNVEYYLGFGLFQQNSVCYLENRFRWNSRQKNKVTTFLV